MKSVQDAIYNWLTIKVVADHRPEDKAAVETEEMFYQILVKEHSISNIETNRDKKMYYVSFDWENKRKTFRFPCELIEAMLNQINNQPERYRNYSTD